MKKLLTLIGVAALLATVTINVNAQTNAPATGGWLSDIWGTISASGVAKATNYAIEPYTTYAPNAPKGSKVGGGLFAAYNFNQYVGAGLAADYLGQFSLVSGNVQLKLPTHPFTGFGGFWTNVAVCPFGLAGVGKALGGTSSSAVAVTDAGAYIELGHLWGGKFNIGAAYGRWDNAGAFSGPRYHIFFGWSKGF